MSSRRKAIRKAIQALLLDKTGAGARVFSNLSSSMWCEELPQIAVFSRSEDIREMNVAPREYERRLELAIEIVAEGSEGPNSGDFVEDILDDIAEQVETELNRDESIAEIEDVFGNPVKLVDALILKTVEFDFVGEGKKPTGSARLVYDVVYHEHRPKSIDEQTGIDDFKTAHVDWSVGHHSAEPDAVVEAQDDISIPE